MTPHRLTAIVAMLSAFPVNADELVDRADANGDGYVSLYELRAAYYADMEFNRRIEQSFADYDTDGDGLISEAERRAAQALAKAQPAPAARTSATVSSETAVTTAAGAAAVGAAAAAADRAPAPAAGMSAATAAQMRSTPATGTAAATAVAAAPAAGLSAAAADTASTQTTQTTQAAETVSPETAGTARLDSRSSGAAPATPAASGSLPDTLGLSRSERLIREIDADKSGGASVRELVASGDGRQWFPDSAFVSADRNSDGDLDPDELEVMLQSLERRRRR